MQTSCNALLPRVPQVSSRRVTETGQVQVTQRHCSTAHSELRRVRTTDDYEWLEDTIWNDIDTIPDFTSPPSKTTKTIAKMPADITPSYLSQTTTRNTVRW
jgi:hypothetical protein